MTVASVASGLSLAMLVFLLLPSSRLSAGARLLLLAALLVAALIPLGTGLALAHYMRGLTDELSVVTLLWLLASVACKFGWLPPRSQTHTWQLWSVFALLGVVLYPAAMGVGMVDSYGWGYAPRWLIAVVGLLVLGLLLLGNWLGVLLLTLASLAFMLDFKASNNYWDYLLDPFVVLYCLGALVGELVTALLKLRRRFAAASVQLDERLD